MARYTGPKNRIARRFGVNLFEKARNPMRNRQNPPGMHGAKKKKKSDYGAQLEEKQKLKAVYGMIPEHMLVRYYREAIRRQGKTPDELMAQLESRLDVVVYRLKMASSIFHAQQLVSHRHFLVDGRIVNVRSFQVKPGMKITLREKSRQSDLIQKSLANTAKEVPSYLSLEADKFTGTLLSVPQADQIALPIIVNVPLVCEFLAHTT